MRPVPEGRLLPGRLLVPWTIVSFPSDSPDPRWERALSAVAFVASAALAAAALRFAWYRPLAAAALLGLGLVVVGARIVARRRLLRLLRSGDVHSVLSRFSSRLDRVPHPATMGPLMTATAFAAYGWVERARAAMAAAERGPAWDAAIEHRLFLDTLLLAFEGDGEAALERATRLARLPLPDAGATMRGRIRTLRHAACALARAFAHRSQPGDRQLLEIASESSPLVYWAMRYAAAVVAIDEGDPAKARELLGEAPAWPAESAFRAFHDEIAAYAALPPMAASPAMPSMPSTFSSAPLSPSASPSSSSSVSSSPRATPSPVSTSSTLSQPTSLSAPSAAASSSSPAAPSPISSASTLSPSASPSSPSPVASSSSAATPSLVSSSAASTPSPPSPLSSVSLSSTSSKTPTTAASPAAPPAEPVAAPVSGDPPERPEA